jgi:SAM-dependent methyltransferase
MFFYMASRTDLLSRGDILHFAPEPGLARHFRARPRGRYVTVDLRNRVDVRGDITRLPFAPDAFDAVICSHILEHVPDDRAALRELFRVLRAGGRATILVPIDPDREHTIEDPSVTGPRERRERFGQSDHVRMYGTDVTARLSSAGFAVEVVKAADLADPVTITRHDLDALDTLFICTKP